MSIGKLSAVSVEPGFVLQLAWDDGFSVRLDLSQLLQRRSVLAPLRDPEAFARAALSHDGWSVEWPCGIDFGAPQLRLWAVSGFDGRAAA